ncbi:MAG TPA: serine/threonine-protein kinase, partial [Nannocystis sp.]
MHSTAAIEHGHELQALESALLAEHTLVRVGFRAPVFDRRYTLVRPLGRGARGLVWCAHDGKMHREIALKLYPYHPGDRLAEEVTREARALAQLRHPAVVQVFDYGHGSFDSNGRECLYVTMECLDGRPLRVWLGEPRTAAEILAVFLRAGEGLVAAHQRGLVHRDFKPDNVVLERDGSPRIVDFGLASAEIVAARADGPEVSLPGERRPVLGTPAYLAPEAIAGQADARSDQFSFAASLWQALFGSFPYDEHAFDSLSRATLRDPPAREDLNPQILVALRRALAPSPAARFADMAALLAALREAPQVQVDHEPTAIARPPAPTSRSGPYLLAGFALIASGAAYGLWPTLEPAVDEPAQRPVPAPPGPTCELDELLAGDWQYHTSVEWSEFIDLIGVSGQYRVGFTTQDNCRYDTLVTKLGDSGNAYPNARRDRVSAQASKLPGFDAHLAAELWLAQRSDAELAQPTAPAVRRRGAHYLVEYTVDGARLVGHWRYFAEKDGHVLMTGALRGGRTAPTSVPAGIADLPCRSQCALLCAGGQAEARCVQDRCRDPRAAVQDCGAPDPDFAASPQTEPGSPLHYYNPDTDRKQPDRCLQIAERLAGAWTFHLRAATGAHAGEATEHQVTLRVAGCTLRGTARDRGV